MTAVDPHAIPMAVLIRELSIAINRLDAYWTENDLPGDYFDENTGYPFSESLDEVAASVSAWLELATDRIVEVPPTEPDPPAKEPRIVEVVVANQSDVTRVHMERKATGIDVHDIEVVIIDQQPAVFLNGEEMFIPPLKQQ